MRVLALDYGSARCGCALSDPSGTLVTPIETVSLGAANAGKAASAAAMAMEIPKLRMLGSPEQLGCESKFAPALHRGKRHGQVNAADVSV